MKLTTYQALAKDTTTQRNALLWVSGVLLLSNLGLVVASYAQARTVVLVPSQMHETLTISQHHVSQEYLTALATDIWTTVLNVTPKNVHYARETLLRRVHPRHFGEIDAQLTALAQDLVQREVSTHFLPMEMRPDTETLTVEVGGYLETYLGKERVGRSYKTYRIQFTRTGSLLTLSAFGEVTHAS